MALNMVHATKRHPHLYGWLLLAILCFIQSPGLIVADTKTDLFLNPANFLGGALHAWTPIFTMGQMQNQAYGYLFPQGLFFLVTHYILPTWVAQRLWWLIVLGLGYSGFYKLVALHPKAVFQKTAALLYALAPHTIATLGAISSETWPAMVAPWILYFAMRPGARGILGSIAMVGCLGAVNATATLAACLPAGLYLLYRVFSKTEDQAQQHLAPEGTAHGDSYSASQNPNSSTHPAGSHFVRNCGRLAGWLAGCAAVSAWWIGPLLILGRYSAPFTDYIESAYVTTRWLGLSETLRGTTSWAPFVSNERLAGYLQATNAHFVIILGVLALVGLIALARAPRFWWGLLSIGLIILVGSAHVTGLLDTSLAAFRNIHKFDLLVRLALCIGIAHIPIPTRETARKALFSAMALLALGSTAPAWAGHLAPQGAYKQVPDYWKEASTWLNANAQGRALLLPDSPFARQTWGWTRDEVLQSYATVPWATRDAIPLIDPETIRGLDGALAVLKSESLDFKDRIRPLARLGIGTIMLRHDLGDSSFDFLLPLARANSLPIQSFGEVDIILLGDTSEALPVTTTAPVTVAGSGESLALLDALNDAPDATYSLNATSPQIVTDTPALTARNYGSIRNNSAGYLASLAEAPSVKNLVKDYATDVAPVSISMKGGQLTASSVASDPGALTGADTARALTAAVDGDPDTAWYPEPGYSGWLDLKVDGTSIAQPVLRLRTTGSATNPKQASSQLLILNGSTRQEVTPIAGKELTIPISGGPTNQMRVYVPRGIGIAEINFVDRPISRTVTVDTATTDTQAFLFQQIMDPTVLLAREFTTPVDWNFKLRLPGNSTVVIDGQEYSTGDVVSLPAGTHSLRTYADWVFLDRGITLSPGPTLVHPAVSFNSGLRLNSANPVRVDAGLAAFEISNNETVTLADLSFVADKTYRLCLLLGGLLWAATMALCIFFAARRPRHAALPAVTTSTDTAAAAAGNASTTTSTRTDSMGWVSAALVLGAFTLVGYLASGLLGSVLVLAGAAISRLLGRYWGRVPVLVLVWTSGLCGLMFAERAPWPAANYSTAVELSSLALAFFLGATLARAFPPVRSSDSPQPESPQ
ncbi:MAG: alpha-(1-_3)-arabinofuranosyltransferase family protein [Corynebacterium sp.]|nr:alpha-(1->3)-arabinofuranosyltransferase family protein [Corynebacterium sp.]